MPASYKEAGTNFALFSIVGDNRGNQFSGRRACLACNRQMLPILRNNGPRCGGNG